MTDGDFLDEDPTWFHSVLTSDFWTPGGSTDHQTLTSKHPKHLASDYDYLTLSLGVDTLDAMWTGSNLTQQTVQMQPQQYQAQLSQVQMLQQQQIVAELQKQEQQRMLQQMQPQQVQQQQVQQVQLQQLQQLQLQQQLEQLQQLQQTNQQYPAQTNGNQQGSEPRGRWGREKAPEKPEERQAESRWDRRWQRNDVTAAPAPMEEVQTLTKIDWRVQPRASFQRSFLQGCTMELPGADNLRHQMGICIEDKGDMHVVPAPIGSFEELNHLLPSYVLEALQWNGIKAPLPIQSQALPLVLSGLDVIGIAQTGSGKTLAYLLPAMVHIAAQPPISRGSITPIALIMAPTRELAVQIVEEAHKVGKRSTFRFLEIRGLNCLNKN